MVYVADAGGNAIYAVDSVSGEFDLFAVIPDLTVLTGVEADPEFGARQPVPTSILLANSRLLQVGLLAEGWDGSVEQVVCGLLFPHGIAFEADGNLYIAVNSIISAPDAPAGQVNRIDGIASPLV